MEKSEDMCERDRLMERDANILKDTADRTDSV